MQPAEVCSRPAVDLELAGGNIEATGAKFLGMLPLALALAGAIVMIVWLSQGRV